jgi:hypothetical protein
VTNIIYEIVDTAKKNKKMIEQLKERVTEFLLKN